MKKFGIKSLLALVLVLILAFSLVACNKECEQHTDEDGNGICDVCEKEFTCRHVDRDPKDGKCDLCKAPTLKPGEITASDFFQGLWDSASSIGKEQIAANQDLAVSLDLGIALSKADDVLADLGVAVDLVFDKATETTAGANSAAKVRVYDRAGNKTVLSIYYFLNDNDYFYIETLGQQMKVAVDYNYNVGANEGKALEEINKFLNNPVVGEKSAVQIMNMITSDFGAEWNLDDLLNTVTGLLGVNIGELIAGLDDTTTSIIDGVLGGLSEDMGIDYPGLDAEGLKDSKSPILDLIMAVGPIIFGNGTTTTANGVTTNKAGLDFSEDGIISLVLPMMGMVLPMADTALGLKDKDKDTGVSIANFGVEALLQGLTELSLEYSVKDGNISNLGFNLGLQTNDALFGISIDVNKLEIKGTDATKAAETLGFNKANYKPHYEINTGLSIEISEGTLVYNGFDFKGKYDMALRGELDLMNTENNSSKVYAYLKKDNKEIAKVTFKDETLVLAVDGKDDTVRFLLKQAGPYLLKGNALAEDEWLKEAVLILANTVFTDGFETSEELAAATTFTYNENLEGLVMTNVDLSSIKYHGIRLIGGFFGGGAESTAEIPGVNVDEILASVWQPDIMAILTAVSKASSGNFTDGLTVNVANVGNLITGLFKTKKSVGPATNEEICYGNAGKKLDGLFKDFYLKHTDGEDEDTACDYCNRPAASWESTACKNEAKAWVNDVFGGCAWFSTSEDALVKLFDSSIKVVLKSDLSGSAEVIFGGSKAHFVKVSFHANLLASDNAISIDDSVFESDTTGANWAQLCLHEYDNDCDTTCNKCNAERTVADHEDTDSDGKCDHCGATINQEDGE